MLDLLITNALIVDGTGAPRFAGSIGVDGDRIAWIGREGAPLPDAARTIDAMGKVVAPGFIDVHNHSDLSALVLPEMPSVIRQGVTSVVVGNCGSSPWPWSSWDDGLMLAYAAVGDVARPAGDGYGEYLEAIETSRPAVNVATLVGHGSIRREVLGHERRAASGDELGRMRAMASEALDAGAFGVSSGLIYVPGIHAPTDEVAHVASAAADAGGIYASHIRGEGRDLFKAVDEAIEIGRRAGLPVHVSHLKCESSLVWGRAGDLLETLHAAEDATGDQYPYAAWNSSLGSLLPPWAPVERVAEIAVAERDRLRTAVEQGELDFQSSIDGVGWDRIVIVGTADPSNHGRSVAAIATEAGEDVFDAFLRLLAEDPDTSCIGHAMSDEDVRAILADPEVFVASDGSATAPDGPGGDLPVHPREYGTFPRALALCRHEELLPLEAVVRKMTSLPADRFGLRGRGRIEEGAFADLVVFDHDEICDTATFDRPHAFPVGIEAVVVNGTVAWRDEEPTDARHGHVLRRSP